MKTPKILWFRKKPKDKAESDTLNHFEIYLAHLNILLRELDTKWHTIQNWEAIISNAPIEGDKPSLIEKGQKKGLMEVYNKKWIAFSLALNLYRTLTQDANRFVSEKEEYLARIKTLDLKLALKIQPITLSAQEGLEFLAPIKAMIDNQQLVISYIKTHYEELLQKIYKIRLKSTADELRRIIITLSNKETDELIKCTNDVRSWSYRLVYGINLFVERVSLYIIGGKSKIDAQAFLGFNMQFRDLELVREMYNSPEVRKILTYSQQIKFFEKAAESILRSVETQGKWEGFYDFYNNLEKGNNYIGKVREVFGNEEFADILKVFKEKKHEAPIEWEKELRTLYNELNNPSYQNIHVTEPAGNALIRIFEARIKRIEEEKAAALDKLKRLLMKKDDLLKIKREFARILKKKRKELLKELENGKIEFESIIREVVLAMPRLESQLIRLIKISDTTQEILEENRLLDLSIAWQRFVLPHVSIFQKDETNLENDETSRSLSKTIAVTYKSLAIAKREMLITNSVSKKYEYSLQLLKELVQFCEDTHLPNIKKCLSYINLRLPNYIDEVSKLLENNKKIGTQNKQKVNIFDFPVREKLNAASNVDYSQKETRKAA